jgi:3-dehydroquinate synthase
MHFLETNNKLGTCSISIDSTLSDILQQYSPRTTIVIIDSYVHSLYRASLEDFQCIILQAGEENKTLHSVQEIYQQLLELDADRSYHLLGIGGGVTCDVCGFVASTFMRGVTFAFIPTTLLAMVDASIGGKNGVNFEGSKNIIGCFNQPQSIHIDTHFLQTLDKEEVYNGLAELIKIALVIDKPFFEFIEAHTQEILALEPHSIREIITKSIALKTMIVERDEKEAGLRKILNFGHTFGHAIEAVHTIAHGKAVSIGMVKALDISMHMHAFAEADRQRVITLLQAVSLPTTIDITVEVLQALRRDKKKKESHIDFILLRSIGEAVITPIAISDLSL